MSREPFALQPYINIFFLRLCPCKSAIRTTSRSSTNFFTIYLVAKIVGCSFLLGSSQARFRSTPANPHRYDPLITPSGFNIGTSLKTKLSRRSLASGDPPVRKSRIPFIICEALLSPGCTRAVITIPFRFLIASGSLEKVVTVISSHMFPAIV